MAYVEGNPSTKKTIREWLAMGREVRCFQPGLGPDLTNHSGVVTCEGPHYPQPHRWYAQVTLVNGIVTSIK